MTTVVDDEQYAVVGRRALAGGRAIVLRYGVVGLISLGGSVVLIRALGPVQWSTYTVGYLLTSFLDQTFGTRLLGGLVHARGRVSRPLQLGAARLMQLVGLGCALALLLLGKPVASVTALPHLALCLTAAGVCGYVYASRSLPLVLLERELKYGWVAASEILDQVVFYAVAIPLVLTGHGLYGVAVGFIARGIPSAVLLMWRSPAPFWGRMLRPEIKQLLRYAVPSLGTGAIVIAEGFLPFVFLAPSHPRQLAFFATAASLIGYGAVAQVVTQRVAFPSLALISDKPAQLVQAVRAALDASLFSLVSVVTPMAALSPLWLPALLGPQWKQAAVPLILIGLGYICSGLTYVLTGALYIRGRPKSALWVSIAMIAMYVTLGAVGYRVSLSYGIAAAFALSRLGGLCLAMRLAHMCGYRLPWGRYLITLALVAVLVVGAARATAAGATGYVVALAAVASVPWILLARQNRSWLMRAFRLRLSET